MLVYCYWAPPGILKAPGQAARSALSRLLRLNQAHADRVPNQVRRGFQSQAFIYPCSVEPDGLR